MSAIAPVGDTGRRYEVTAVDGSGARFVVGWTDAPDGGALVRSVNLHPTWRDPQVRDRWVTKVGDGGFRYECSTCHLIWQGFRTTTDASRFALEHNRTPKHIAGTPK